MLSRRFVHPLKTTGALGLLGLMLPFNAALTGAAVLRGALLGWPETATPARPLTILISGGKMTKALHLARAFHRAGHRVILAESAHYRLTGHRFSRAVARFYVIPAGGGQAYTQALLEIVQRERVDVYVPVCSPASSRWDAEAKPILSEHCQVIHGDEPTIAMLDDKHRFAETADSLGLSVPDAHRVTSPDAVAAFDFEQGNPPYVLKSIPYDPIRRLDLTPLPRESAEATRRFAVGLPISPERPWVLQAFISGREFCTHSTVRGGRVQLHCCCESSAFQLNYEHVEMPEIEAWVRAFVGALSLTGQYSFDFIEGDDGQLYAIECNPRTHSAITLFYGHPDVARAYLQDGVETVFPGPGARPTYWLYNELWRAVRRPRVTREVIGRILRGKEAIFAWDDPLPFLLVHHLQIPSLLLDNLRRGRPWLRIDFNIGKLVEPGGD